MSVAFCMRISCSFGLAALRTSQIEPFAIAVHCCFAPRWLLLWLGYCHICLHFKDPEIDFSWFFFFWFPFVHVARQLFCFECTSAHARPRQNVVSFNVTCVCVCVHNNNDKLLFWWKAGTKWSIKIRQTLVRCLCASVCVSIFFMFALVCMWQISSWSLAQNWEKHILTARTQACNRKETSDQMREREAGNFLLQWPRCYFSTFVRRMFICIGLMRFSMNSMRVRTHTVPALRTRRVCN